MTSSPQRRSDQNSGHGRLFETYSPSSNPPKRIVVKRSTTLEDASKTLNWAGTLERLVERSYSSLQNEALAIEYVSIHTTIPVPKVITTSATPRLEVHYRHVQETIRRSRSCLNGASSGTDILVLWSVIASMMEEGYEIQVSK